MKLIPARLTRDGRARSRLNRDMFEVATGLGHYVPMWSEYTNVWLRTSLVEQRFQAALDALVDLGDVEVDGRTFHHHDKPATTVFYYRLTQRGRDVLYALQADQ